MCSCYTTVGTLIDTPKNYMYALVKLDYKLDPPLYNKAKPENKEFIKEIKGEGTSIIRDCYNAYKEAVDELLAQTNKDEEVYSITWFHFSNKKYTDQPICKRSKGSGLFFGEKTVVMVKGLLVKKNSIKESPAK